MLLIIQYCQLDRFSLAFKTVGKLLACKTNHGPYIPRECIGLEKKNKLALRETPARNYRSLIRKQAEHPRLLPSEVFVFI